MTAGLKERWMLVVEDNIDDEKLATRVYEKTGRTEKFVVARDGEEALQILRDNPNPALVLLDLKLPRFSGIDVLMEVKDNERLRTIPIVVLTSSDERSDIAACYELGCSAFVRKPVDYNEYVRQLNTVFDFWLSVNVPYVPARSLETV